MNQSFQFPPIANFENINEVNLKKIYNGDSQNLAQAPIPRAVEHLDISIDEGEVESQESVSEHTDLPDSLGILQS